MCLGSSFRNRFPDISYANIHNYDVHNFFQSEIHQKYKDLIEIKDINKVLSELGLQGEFIFKDNALFTNERVTFYFMVVALNDFLLLNKQQIGAILKKLGY